MAIGYVKAIHAATEHTDGWVNKKDRKKWEHFSFRTLKKVYDAKVIKAEFLIHHIDQAFEVFEKDLGINICHLMISVN